MSDVMSDSVAVSSEKLWWAALKLPIYSVAIMPIWLGSALAWAESGNLYLGRFFLFLAAAVLILAWLNLSNDVFDADTGIDRHKYHSVVNLTGKKNLILWLSHFCLALGGMGIGAIAYLQHDGTILGLVALCCLLGYLYQGPPFRLGYLGLGEPLCFLAFGPLAIAAAYYSQTQAWSTLIWPVGTILGLTTTLILFCSHFHQIADDLAAGKHSPVARLGTQTSSRLVQGAIAIVFIMITLGVGLRVFPPLSLLSLAALPWGIQLIRQMQQFHDQPEQIKTSKFVAANLHFVSGLLFGLGWIL